MKGKFWTGLLNPMVAAQNFEYKVGSVVSPRHCIWWFCWMKNVNFSESSLGMFVSQMSNILDKPTESRKNGIASTSCCVACETTFKLTLVFLLLLCDPNSLRLHLGTPGCLLSLPLHRPEER